MSVVHVIFVDASSGEKMAEVDLQDSQLPATFAVATTMHLGDADWDVEAAVPVTREEFAKSGRLELRLRQIVKVAPESILYSLPTIENALPAAGPVVGEPVHLHEDWWRQCEFVAMRFAGEIESEFAGIRAVRAAAIGGAFKNIHVRKRIPAPLEGVNLRIVDMESLFGAAKSLSFGPSRGEGFTVKGGFAYPRPGGAVFGVAGSDDIDRLDALCLWQGDVAKHPLVELAAPLAAIAAAHDLVLVDWCRAVQLRSTGGKFVLVR